MIACALLVSTSCKRADRDPGRTYDRKGRFSLKAPQGFEVQYQLGKIAVNLLGDKSKDSPLRPHIAIELQRKSGRIDLDRFVKASEHTLPRLFSDFMLHEKSAAVVGGRRAFRWVISYRDGQLRLKNAIYAVARGRRLALITCGAPLARFDAHLPVCKAAVDSFRFE